MTDEIQRYLASYRGKSSEEDLEFSVDPTLLLRRVGESVGHFPNLWLARLADWCSSVGPHLRINLTVQGETLLAYFGPLPQATRTRLASERWRNCSPLAGTPEGRFQRIHLELNSSLNSVFVEFVEGEFCRFEISGKGKAEARLEELLDTYFRPYSSHAVLNRVTVTSKGHVVSRPAWRAPWFHKNESTTVGPTMSFNFETVETVVGSEPGFPWRILAAGQRCGEIHPFLAFHYRPCPRGFCSDLIFGMYDEELLRKVQLKPKAYFLDMTVKRVMGVCWKPDWAPPAQIRPVVNGFLAEPIFLPNLPDGVLCYAYAGGLETDLSGFKLVTNRDYEQWLEDQLAWLERQVKSYAGLVHRVEEFRACLGHPHENGPTLFNRNTLSRAWRKLKPGTDPLTQRVMELRHWAREHSR